MKKININEVIWFIILSCFVLLIYKLFRTDKIYTYIHPRMFKHVYFSLIVFLILTISQLKKLVGHKSNGIKLGNLIFLVPLILAFTVNPDSLSAQVVSNKGVNIVNHELTLKSNNQEEVNKDYHTDRIEDVGDVNQSNEENIESITIHDTSQENADEDIVHIPVEKDEDYYDPEAESFLDILMAIYDNLETMVGEEVELSGFIYRESEFPEERFVISRLLMTCCAADTQIAGLLCEWDDTARLDPEGWFRVKGVIEKVPYTNSYTNEEEIIPVIKVSAVETIEQPEIPYIYP